MPGLYNACLASFVGGTGRARQASPLRLCARLDKDRDDLRVVVRYARFYRCGTGSNMQNGTVDRTET